MNEETASIISRKLEEHKVISYNVNSSLHFIHVHKMAVNVAFQNIIENQFINDIIIVNHSNCNFQHIPRNLFNLN